MSALTDIPYGPHPAHILDIHLPPSPQPAAVAPPLVCFVHGGAWRSEDKADHIDLGRRVAAHTRCPVAIVNYRLSPSNPLPNNTFYHPSHALDVLRALEFLVGWTDLPASLVFDRARIVLFGHSCGAHILTSIFLDSSFVTPELTPPPAVIAATLGVALCEGIYDLDRLITSFPTYKGWFIRNAFGDHEDYKLFNTAEYPLRKDAAHIHWLIIHSTGDTLVDQVQAETIFESLYYKTRRLGLASVDRLVEKDWTTITSDHHDLLLTEQLSNLMTNFIACISLDWRYA